MTDLELADAWEELQAATPPGWYVGRPSRHPERGEWIMYAYDPSERPKGRPSEPRMDGCGVDPRKG